MAAGLLVYDVLYFSLATLLYGGAAYATATAYARFATWMPWHLALVPSLVVGLLALIAEVSVASAVCPRLRPGRYPMMKGAVFFGWIFRSMLRRILLVPGLRWIIFSSNVLRWLALRGMGARVAFASNASVDADFLDPSLITIAPGATIGMRCVLSGHYVDKGELVLGEVRVGRGSLLAADVGVAPMATIGERVMVKVRVTISVGVTIRDGANIGAGVLIDPYATVGKSARIASRVHVPSRANVPDHAILEEAASFSSTTRSAAPEV
jgi:acetyltransferase-like isoleucine patch superfamily enzyme